MRRFQAILLSCAALIISAVAGKAADMRHVVLVHGIHDDDGTGMKNMADFLWEKGVTAHVLSYAPSNGSVGIDDLARQFASYVEREMPYVRRFDVVAFSMGGLVARCYIQNLGGAKRVGKFVEISSPNHGTWDAYLLWNAAGRQMRPGSDFLNALNANLDCYRGIQWSTIRTPLDVVILPSNSSEMTQAKNFTSQVPLHPLMVLNPQVNELVLASLNRRLAGK
jgi:triacylglycerol lipase